EALALTERVYALTPWANTIVGQLAALLVRTGEKQRAEALLEPLRPGAAYGAPTGMAMFHAMCGEFDRAFDWAARALAKRDPEYLKILRPWLQSRMARAGATDESIGLRLRGGGVFLSLFLGGEKI